MERGWRLKSLGIKSRALVFYHATLERMERFVGRKRLDKLYDLLSLKRLIEMGYILVLLLFSAGAINALLEGTNPNIIGITIIPSFSFQSLLETFLNLFATAVGTLGIYLMYLGGRRTGTKRAPSLYVLSGLTTLIISMLIWWIIISVKGR
ncbi:MAG: hypothetical protein ACUVWK_06475 [Nitrososphaerales archaeon]